MSTLVKMDTVVKMLTEISMETMQEASNSIKNMVAARKLKLDGEISTLVPVVFPSKNKKKDFQRSLGRALNSPGMKAANIYLHKLEKYNGEKAARIEYSDKEKVIKLARKEWKEAQLKMWALRDKYKAEKKGFYKS